MQAPVFAPTSLPPDYNVPETAFVPADFNKLATEFIDTYAGQYVVFEAIYGSHRQGASLISTSGEHISAKDQMSMMLYDPAAIQAMMASGVGAAARTVTVLWSVEDKELGLPLLSLTPNQKVRIYGYVVPVGQKTRLKTSPDMIRSPFRAPVILLIRAVPVAA